MTITKAMVCKAIQIWPSRYTTRHGYTFVGERVSAVSASLRNAGWRQVPRLDAYDLRQMGLEIVEAQYVGGVRPTGRFIDVVIVPPAGEQP